MTGSTVEIDLDSLFFANQNLSDPFYAEVWACQLPVCLEFWPGGLPGPTGESGLLWNGTATTAVYLVSTPEPGTLGLCLLGLLALLLRKKSLCTRPEIRV